MKYMVITRDPRKRGKYAGSWHKSKAAAHRFGKSLGVRYIVTSRPKRHYRF